jgi:hypothetical protein
LIILWIRKRKTEKQNDPVWGGKESFEKHNEAMKQFRRSHPDASIINAKDIITADDNLLAPVQNVKLAKNAQN